jgi:hypothetical protein
MGSVSPEQGAERRLGLVKQPLDLELPVVAMGARPGDTSEKRELFTEDTQTVLVFENGCVIQLAAAVAVGQLVFLTNKETGKEIITQVLRKRSHRPTDCYVELEFTEPAPSFWGQEFPDIETPLKMDVSAGSEAATVAESEVTEEDSNQAVAPPEAAEVERLRKEVEALRAQLKAQTQETPEHLMGMQQPSASELESLKSLLGSKARADEEEEKPAMAAQEVAKGSNPAPVTISSEKLELMSPHEAAPAVTSAAPSAPQPTDPSPALPPYPVQREEQNASYPIRMTLPKAEGTSQRTSEFAADSAAITHAQDEHLLPTPSLDFEQFPGVSEPSPKLFSGKATRSLSGPIGVLVAITLLLVAAGIMTYRMGWLSGLGTKSPKTANNAHSAFPTNSAANGEIANNNPATGTTAVQPGKPDVPVNGTNSASGKMEEDPAASNANSTSAVETGGGHEVTPAESVHTSAGNSKPVDKRNPKHNSAITHEVAAVQPVVPDDGTVVPPKLVKAIKSLSPPEALRGYVSGKVTLDAVVDEAGHVKSATPISGPKALYAKAVETMMQYEYLPATKGGKPVQAHVQVAIQFWYEP